MFSLLSELSTEQHPRNNQLAHNMIGEHFHTVSFLKNIMDQADIMTENTRRLQLASYGPSMALRWPPMVPGGTPMDLGWPSKDTRWPHLDLG